ncbi:dihydroorotase [Robiginitalea myxolifaciens]|uniref:Dihydroorotase n=1 Tax=Robiginitalea myxolifaciens TaxID=400055 RepID=A0A1I6G8T5_9FLAO|nr:dihydroorotase [Robiginitalea myxolifaciens]SFR38603.1 dihydroorotase [Robiginitalea myxolifaciens]
MKKTLLTNARLVNEGEIREGDLLIEGERIARIDSGISDPNARVIDLEGSFLMPGGIDDQVHFREPGLTHKGNIATESRAAVAGGITTFMEQPNTKPQTTSIEALEAKHALAAESAHANYSFLFGGTNDNLEELKRLDPLSCSGVKLFLGSSTGNMLVDDEKVLESIFRSTQLVISAHCEDETTIRENLERYNKKYGDDIPMSCHPEIRSEEACYLSSSKAVALARATGARLHVFHLSTAKETELFRNDIPLAEKQITAEVCLHHLWFSDAEYENKGSLIKWNPAVKTAADREGLWEALLDDRIDIIATDHAPHTWEEKQNPYTSAPSGGPLVQHLIPALMEKSLDGVISPERIVEKLCHNPAIRFDIADRGYLREGFYADLAVVETNSPWTVAKENLLYKCGWSPFEGTRFRSRISHTFVNGHLAFEQGQVAAERHAKRLTFNRQ